MSAVNRRRRKRLHIISWVTVAVIMIAMAIGLVVKYTRVFEPPITAETTLVVTEGTSIEELKELLEEMEKVFKEISCDKIS